MVAVPLAELEEVGPLEQPAAVVAGQRLVLLVEHDVLEPAGLEEAEVLARELEGLGDDELALGVLGDVGAGGLGVGGVDADGQAAREEAPEEGHVPLGRVESDDVDRREVEPRGHERFPEAEALVEVLLVGYRFLRRPMRTHLPSTFTDSAGRSGCTVTTRWNSSMSVVGRSLPDPAFLSLMGSSML